MWGRAWKPARNVTGTMASEPSPVDWTSRGLGAFHGARLAPWIPIMHHNRSKHPGSAQGGEDQIMTSGDAWAG